MKGLTLLAFTIVCLASVCLSQPIDSAKDTKPAPETTVPSTSGKPPEADAEEGGDKGESQFQTTYRASEDLFNISNNLFSILSVL